VDAGRVLAGERDIASTLSQQEMVMNSLSLAPSNVKTGTWFAA
jgi:hypothetical protein